MGLGGAGGVGDGCCTHRRLSGKRISVKGIDHVVNTVLTIEEPVGVTRLVPATRFNPLLSLISGFS